MRHLEINILSQNFCTITLPQHPVSESSEIFGWKESAQSQKFFLFWKIDSNNLGLFCFRGVCFAYCDLRNLNLHWFALATCCICRNQMYEDKLKRKELFIVKKATTIHIKEFQISCYEIGSYVYLEMQYFYEC